MSGEYELHVRKAKNALSRLSRGKLISIFSDLDLLKGPFYGVNNLDLIRLALIGVTYGQLAKLFRYLDNGAEKTEIEIPQVGDASSFSPGHNYTDEELHKMCLPRKLPPFGVSQLKGFGPENFLVSGKDRAFMVGAEFRPASGNMYDRAFMASAINTAPDMAKEILELRARLRAFEKDKNENHS